MANDAFHAPVAGFAGMTGILVVVDGEFHEEQVGRALGENMLFQSKGSSGGTSGRNTRIGKSEVGCRETLLKPSHHERAVAIHFRDGASHEGDVPLLFVLKEMERIIKTSTEEEVRVECELFRIRARSSYQYQDGEQSSWESHGGKVLVSLLQGERFLG